MSGGLQQPFGRDSRRPSCASSCATWRSGAPQRCRVAARYDELLAGLPVTTPYDAPGMKHVYHQYTIRAPRRDELRAFLSEQGIGTMIYYPVPLHRQEMYAGLDLGEGSLPESEQAAKEVLSLPIYPEMTDEQIEQVASAVRRFYEP